MNPLSLLNSRCGVANRIAILNDIAPLLYSAKGHLMPLGNILLEENRAPVDLDGFTGREVA